MKVNLENNGNGMTNVEILEHGKNLQFLNFKYRMRNELTGEKPLEYECGVLNFDNMHGDGTHHCCWWVDNSNKQKTYFDSYDCIPPEE